jgi:BON domain
MTRILLAALLLLSTPFALGWQQQPQSQTPQTQSPPYTTPPTLPDNRPQTQQPPETQAPAAASSEIQDQIQRSISKDPALSDAQVNASVDEQTITLSGTVQDETEHQKVLQVVQSYAGQRKIDDKLVVRQKS